MRHPARFLILRSRPGAAIFGGIFHGLLFIVAIDGPAGSGKSTTARGVAGALGFLHLDTGAMYRTVTHLALTQSIQLNDSKALVNLARGCNFEFRDDSAGRQRVSVNGDDVTTEIRSDIVNSHVSQVAAIADVRKVLVEKQREFAKSGNGIVAEGRDVSTVVFPNADLKVYLDATISERAKRRAIENQSDDSRSEQSRLAKRDKIDSTRAASPLTRAEDAVAIDTTDLSIEQQVDAVVALAKARMKKQGMTSSK